MSRELNEEFWSQRYADGTTGWDVGQVTTPLKEYIDQLEDKSIEILIPGAGNSYEGEYLWRKGFRNVKIVDISQAPLDNIAKRVPDFPSDHLIHANFFDLKGSFDLILEQTFYCALDPSLRPEYERKMTELIRPGGTLAGVYFRFPLTEEGPPFGGSIEEYENRFSEHFDIRVLEDCRNSIPPRMGREAFMIAKRKLAEKE